MTRPVAPVTLALALAAGVGWLGFPGLLWDVAWHRSVGRDTFLSPPHVLMYAGVGVNGLVAAWAVGRGARERGLEAFGCLAGAVKIPLGFGLAGAGVLMAVAAAILDELWHRLVGKDVNLWSPPHLAGLAGTMLIVVGLAFALASHTRYARRPQWAAPRVLLLFFFADLTHKSMVALDHYTLDAWGRTPDFYPFLLALLLPAVFMTATRAVGVGAATAGAAVFSVQHVVIVTTLSLAGLRTPTLSPIPILPALALDGAVLAAGAWRGRALTAAAAGLAFAATLYANELAWMWLVVGRPWPLARAAASLPGVAVTAAASAWVGWALGGFIRACAEGRPAAAVFGSSRRARRVLVAMLVVTSVGLAGAYRPSRAAPPATVANLTLAPDADFAEGDAIFWEAQLPDGWRQPGTHRTYQEGIVDGRPFPVGPAWCAADEATLARDLDRLRLGLAINGERVALEDFPSVRRRSRSARVCQWVAVSATTPRPGRQTLVYTVEYASALSAPEGTLGPGVSTVVIDLTVKEP
jgi:hypothetical protein